MKPKNVMLLGFVNKAVEYLDKHLDDDTPDSRLSELKNIDLQALRKELSENLDSSLGTMQNTMTTLLRAGNEAFDCFIGDTSEKENVIEQLDKIFDVDFDSKESKEKDELSRLLSFYNLEDQFEVDDEYPELLNPSKEEKDNFDDDDDIMKQIRENATRARDNKGSNRPEIYSEGIHELDSIFSEIVTAEDGNIVPNSFNAKVNPIIIEDIPTLEKDEIIDSVEEDKLANVNIIEEIEEEAKQEENEVIEEVQQEGEDVVDHVPEIVEETIQEEPRQQIYITNPLVDSVADEPTVVEVKAPTPVMSVSEKVDAQEYTSSLIDDLRKQMIVEDEKKRVVDEKKAQVYDKLHEIYPYLTQAFVGAVYDLKEDINNEYPLDIDIILLHRLVFDDLDKLRQFVEVVLKHDYAINADENKMIVDVFKEFTNSDGRILSNIFEIANQGYLLGGYYDGYRVIKK